MNALLKLSIKSWRNRKLTTALTILSISLSVMLLIGIERVRLGMQESFSNTISKTDLIVGARGGSLPLLLYSVFHIGTATNNISYAAYQKIKSDPAVKWTIPLSMGDSHKGYRVIATDDNFYTYFKYHDGESLSLSMGTRPGSEFDVVMGAEAYQKLRYKLGDEIIITHGLDNTPFARQHKANPFKIAGVLAQTNTPVDRAFYITLNAMQAIHSEVTSAKNTEPKITQITSFYLGAQSRVETLGLQRQINEFADEPLMAIIPGVALSELWRNLSYAEDALKLVSFFVVLVGALGMWIAIHSSLSERRREMSILRAIGAEPMQIFSLFVLESTLLGFFGILCGVIVAYLTLFLAKPLIEHQFGFYLPLHPPEALEYGYMLSVQILCITVGIVPAFQAYQTSLSDGLTVRT